MTEFINELGEREGTQPNELSARALGSRGIAGVGGATIGEYYISAFPHLHGLLTGIPDVSRVRLEEAPFEARIREKIEAHDRIRRGTM